MKKFEKILSVALSAIILMSVNVFSANAESADKYVYLGGQSFGVRFYADGVIVIELENYFDGRKYVCPAKESGLKVNDVIRSANGEKITSNEQLEGVLRQSEGKEIELTVERNGNEISKTVKPVKNVAGLYLIGAWIRDSCAGIGTVTYYDRDNNYFAALGHGICDSDTSALMPLASGEVVQAEICGITKGSPGKAGSLNGYFTDSKIGDLTKNTPIGVYGTIYDNCNNIEKRIKIADKNDISVGKAEMYTTVNGSAAESYSIEIKKICNSSQNSNENFIIKITDKRLLESCGGIVQGMSGSPIVQNGKLVGAVTHVFLNQPDEGFGIIAQNMLLNY